MKILKTIFLLTILIILNSCSKDEINKSNGYVQFENNKYELNYAYIEEIVLLNGVQIRLYLSDNEINFTKEDIEITKPSDNYLAFILHNPNSDFEKLSDYYPLSTDYENINIEDNIPFLVHSQTTFNIKTSQNPNQSWEFEYRNFLWNDGSLTLDTQDSKVQINFSLKKDSKVIKGEFIGTLKDISED